MDTQIFRIHDRRDDDRVDRWLPVELRAGKMRRMAVVKNLSRGGLLVASSGPFAVGDEITIRFKQPSVEVLCAVVMRSEHAEEVDAFPYRLGVRVTELVDSRHPQFKPMLPIAKTVAFRTQSTRKSG